MNSAAPRKDAVQQRRLASSYCIALPAAISFEDYIAFMRAVRSDLVTRCPPPPFSPLVVSAARMRKFTYAVRCRWVPPSGSVRAARTSR